MTDKLYWYLRFLRPSLLIVLSAIVLLPAGAGNCQQAPPRFKKFEFPTNFKYIQPYGDTLILHGDDDFEVTTNGGESWETIPLPTTNPIFEVDDHPLLYWIDDRPNDSILSIQISEDLGHSFKPRSIGKDTVAELHRIGFNLINVVFSPWNPANIYLQFSGASASAMVYLMLRSNDGGRTWYWQELPENPDGEGFVYGITFNRLVPNRWHLSVSGWNHAWSKDIFYTDDDGKTFVPVTNWAPYAGIEFPDQLMRWGPYETGAEIARGPSWSNINSSEWIEDDWFYRAGLSNFRTDGEVHYGFAHSTLRIWSKDPKCMIVRLDSHVRNPDRQYVKGWYMTSDAGQTIKELWADSAYLDARFDGRDSKIWVNRYTTSEGWSLWYTTFQSSSVRERKDAVGIVDVYPNPTSEYIYVNPKNSTGQVRLTDMLGRVWLQVRLNVQQEDIRLSLQDIPTGSYWVTLETGASISRQLVKVIK